MSIALYALTSQYRQLAERLAGLDLDLQTISDTIEASGIVDDLQTKAQGVLMIAQGAEMHNAAIDGEIARLQALKAQRGKVAQGLRDYLLTNMQAASIEKIECPLFKISIRKNPPALEILDLSEIPAEFMVTPEPKPVVAAPDKAAIKKLLIAGSTVPGTQLTQGVRLVIT